MASNDYHFVTEWLAPGTAEEVAALIADAPGLARWWPAVYLDVQQLDAGDARGVGKVVDLYTKGWLPYTLRWRFLVTEVDLPRRLVLEATGDFVGRGEWTFAPDESDSDLTRVTYDWRIRAEKPLLRSLSFLLKPIFAANHRWAMSKGEESLLLELARRHAPDEAARALIPPPPGPTTAAPLLVGFAAALLAVALVVLVARGTRRTV
jgi:hypothetical protein